MGFDGQTEELDILSGEQQEYEERYNIIVQFRGVSCFFLEDLQQGYTLPIYFFVLSTRARAQMDVGRTSKDHDKRQEYEEGYNIIVQLRGAFCFFLEDRQQGYTFPVHFFVLSVRVGAQKDVGRTFKDHDRGWCWGFTREG